MLLLAIAALTVFPVNPHEIWGFVDTQSCAKNQLSRIEWAISEEETQHFVEELRLLYPKLERCGLRMPMLEPVELDHVMYNRTWHGFHLTFLKALRRAIAYRVLDVSQWNSDVERENAERVKGGADGWSGQSRYCYGCTSSGRMLVSAVAIIGTERASNYVGTKPLGGGGRC